MYARARRRGLHSLATTCNAQVSEVAMVAEHEDHTSKKSTALWQIKLQDTPCVSRARAGAPRRDD